MISEHFGEFERYLQYFFENGKTRPLFYSVQVDPDSVEKEKLTHSHKNQISTN